MNKIIKKSCLNCSKIFDVLLKYINRGGGKYCSQKCFVEYRKNNKKQKEPNVKCALCGKKFYKSASRRKVSKSGLYFCCRKHKDKAQRIGGIKEILPAHYGKYKGQEHVKSSVYRKIALSSLPNKCNRCGYDHFIQIMHVHHKDRDRKNNDLSNLEILCPTCHYEHHYNIS